MNYQLCKRLQIPFQHLEHGKEDGNNKTAEVSLKSEPNEQERKAEITEERVDALKANEPCIHLTSPRQYSTRTSHFNTEQSVKHSDLKKCDSLECHRNQKQPIIGLEWIGRSHFRQRQELEKRRGLTRLRKSLQCLVEGSEALTRIDLEKHVYASKKVPLTLKIQGKLQRFLLWDIAAWRKRGGSFIPS